MAERCGWIRDEKKLWLLDLGQREMQSCTRDGGIVRHCNSAELMGGCRDTAKRSRGHCDGTAYNCREYMLGNIIL